MLLPTCRPFLVVHQFRQHVFMLGGPWGLSRMSTCATYHREISLSVAVCRCCHYCGWSLCRPPPPPPRPPPPHFIPAWDDWGKTYSAQQFPMFDDIPQFLRLKLMCLASMVHHRRFIVERFNANHVVLASGQLFRDEAVLQQLDNNPGCVVVTYLWSSNEGSFTWVPPHVAVLQELQSLKVKQQSLIDSFVSKVKTAIEECDLSGGSLTEQRLRQIFDGFSADIREQLRHVGEGAENTEDVDAQRIETGQGYCWHYFDGHFHRVPRIGAFPALVFLKHGSSGGLVILFGVFHH